ncbi:MAG TPA: hypothetical protein PLN31_11130 [Azoarcus taiwanensis]|nr:hypothetical protein [Azoarcus taiwanensis]
MLRHKPFGLEEGDPKGSPFLAGNSRSNGLEYLWVGLMFGALLACYWALGIGLGPGFHLDDQHNLSPLANFNQHPSLTSALTFVRSGDAGPTGRPLSLIFFLLDASHWPQDASALRKTNVLLHLCNGLLVFLLIFRLAASSGVRSASQLAFWISALWMLSPAHTATTLYVIQRMTLLSTFFVLLGLWVFFLGRYYLSLSLLCGYASRDYRRGLILVLSGCFIGIGLGVLAKESAVVFGALVLVIEATIFSGQRRSKLHISILIALALSQVVLWVHLLMPWSAFIASYELRDFVWYERLLTQPLVLITYVGNIVVPRADVIGIFGDQFPVAKNILEFKFLISTTLILLVVSFAWVIRRRSRWLSCCILLFFAAHSLESSVLNLEVYFEHRNYLPSVAIITALVIALEQFFRKYLIRIRFFIGGAVLALLTMITYTAAMPWGNPELAASVWPRSNPDSIRLKQMAAGVWVSTGQYHIAQELLRNGVGQSPELLILWLQLTEVNCLIGESVEADWVRMMSAKVDFHVNRDALDTLESLLEKARLGVCEGLDLVKINSLLSQVVNAKVVKRVPFLATYTWFLYASSYALQMDVDRAFRALLVAEESNPELRGTFWRVVWAINAGRADLVDEILIEDAKSSSLYDASYSERLSSERRVIDLLVERYGGLAVDEAITIHPYRLEEGDLDAIRVVPLQDAMRRIIVID